MSFCLRYSRANLTSAFIHLNENFDWISILNTLFGLIGAEVLMGTHMYSDMHHFVVHEKLSHWHSTNNVYEYLFTCFNKKRIIWGVTDVQPSRYQHLFPNYDSSICVSKRILWNVSSFLKHNNVSNWVDETC